MVDSKIQYGQDRRLVVQRSETFAVSIPHIANDWIAGGGSATSELNVQSGHSKEESLLHPPVTIRASFTESCDETMDKGGRFPSYARSQVVSCPTMLTLLTTIGIMAVNL